jgi:hypothetical protein
MSKKTYAEYQEETSLDVQECLQTMQCQPILFVGSGFSRRYLNAPDWHGLLEVIAKKCPHVDKEYAYYRQRTAEPPDIATELASVFQEWAWSSGKKKFPQEMFTNETHADSYLKFVVAKYLESITPADLKDIKPTNLSSELRALQNIAPHAVITTNYDRFLEAVFAGRLPAGNRRSRNPRRASRNRRDSQDSRMRVPAE